jgi:phosphatidate cytidylyltransferase
MPAGELTRRWAVALVGIPAVFGLLYVGGWTLGVPIALLAALGAREAFDLAEAGAGAPLRALGSGAAALLVLLAVFRPTFMTFAPWALATLGALLLVAFLMALARGPERAPMESVGATLLGALYVGLPLAFVPLLHALPTVEAWGQVGAGAGVWIGLLVVTLPLATSWVGDAVALFAGTAWGRSKLAPSISPKKSWVGAWAGLVGSVVAAVAWFYLVRGSLPGLPLESALAAAAAGAGLAVTAQLGDLVESLLKRQAGVKDSGTVFPGHGGVLDRIDALVFSLPLAYTILVTLGG